MPTMEIPNLGRFLTRHGRFEAFWQETQGSKAIPLEEQSPGARLPFYNVRFRLTGRLDVLDVIVSAAAQIGEGTAARPDVWSSDHLNKCGLSIGRVAEVLDFAEAMRNALADAERSGKSPEARQPVVNAWLACAALTRSAVRDRQFPYRARDYYPARLEAVDALKRAARRLPPAPIPTPQEDS